MCAGGRPACAWFKKQLCHWFLSTPCSRNLLKYLEVTWQNAATSGKPFQFWPSWFISFLWFQGICGSIAIVGFQQSHDLDKVLVMFFTFLSLELKVINTTSLTGSIMTGNYHTSTIHSIIKFENWLPSGWNKFHQKLQQNHRPFSILFFLLWITTNKII